MRLRWTFVIATVAAVIAAFILRQQRVQDGADVAQARTNDASTITTSAHGATVASTATRAPAPPSDATTESRGSTASGAIHFEREESSARSSTPIDVNVRAAVGLWQPAEHRLLIYLLEQAPTAAETTQLLSALSSGAHAPSAGPGGMISVEFMPTAQAFDRNEIDRASLTAWNGRGDRSEADVLGSLDWSGSLPSPQAQGAPSVTQLELKASGRGHSIPIAWRQSWNFSVTTSVSAAVR